MGAQALAEGFEAFAAEVTRAGHKAKDCGNGHWQAIGAATVNWYRPAGTMYVHGAKGSKKNASLADVIEAAGSPVREHRLAPEDLSAWRDYAKHSMTIFIDMLADNYFGPGRNKTPMFDFPLDVAARTSFAMATEMMNEERRLRGLQPLFHSPEAAVEGPNS